MPKIIKKKSSTSFSFFSSFLPKNEGLERIGWACHRRCPSAIHLHSKSDIRFACILEDNDIEVVGCLESKRFDGFRGGSGDNGEAFSDRVGANKLRKRSHGVKLGERGWWEKKKKEKKRK